MPNTKILAGDCIESLKQLPDKSVNCCVTSPPYYGLRDYGTATWEGGDPNCSHKRDSKQSALTITGHKNLEGEWFMMTSLQNSLS
jgi:DNA modification methylase